MGVTPKDEKEPYCCKLWLSFIILCKRFERWAIILWKKYWFPIIICMSVIFLGLTILSYLGAYMYYLTNWTRPAQTVTVSSEGPAAEMYPDYMGQYNVLRDVYRNDRVVYKHVDREDRFIIFAGKINIIFLLFLDSIDKVKFKNREYYISLILYDHIYLYIDSIRTYLRV